VGPGTRLTRAATLREAWQSRTNDPLQITKALFVQPTWSNSRRPLIRQPFQGRILPPGNAPRRATAHRFRIRIRHVTCVELWGFETPDLLHAMNHSPVPGPGDMRPDQARRQLTLAAPGPGELPLAPFCSSIRPSK
jgi:hypothetical protein